MSEHALHGTLKGLLADQTQVDGLLQVGIVRPVREVHVVAAVNGRSSLEHHRVDSLLSTALLSLFTLHRQLVNGRVVTHHHAVETQIAAQNVLQNLCIGSTLHAMHLMVAGHDHTAALQTDHRLMGQQYLLHQLLLAGITAAAIA